MADNPKIRDGRDRAKVSKQANELKVLQEKFGISPQAARGAQDAAGPNRPKVEAYIRKKIKDGDYK